MQDFVYKIDTADRIYELTGGRRGSLNVGEEVNFRIEKKKAYVLRGPKEQRFEVTGVELNTQR